MHIFRLLKVPENILPASASKGLEFDRTCWILALAAWPSDIELYPSRDAGLWHWHFRKYWHTWELNRVSKKNKRLVQDIKPYCKAPFLCDSWLFKIYFGLTRYDLEWLCLCVFNSVFKTDLNWIKPSFKI